MGIFFGSTYLNNLWNCYSDNSAYAAGLPLLDLNKIYHFHESLKSASLDLKSKVSNSILDRKTTLDKINRIDLEAKAIPKTIEIALPELKIDTENYVKFKNNFLAGVTPSIPFTLCDAGKFLQLRQNVLIQGNPPYMNLSKIDVETIYLNLKSYYTTTHLLDEFEALETEIVFKTAFLLTDRKDFLFSENAQIQQIYLTSLENIWKKIQSDPSVSGHPNQLISAQDIDFFEKMKSSSNKKITELTALIQGSLDIEIEKVDKTLALYSDLFAKLEHLSNPPLKGELSLVVEGKLALLALELSDVGRKFNLQDIAERTLKGSPYTKGLQKLFLCRGIRGEEVDLAVLQTICNEHDKAKSHPKVVVEGGGPSGLLLAITQYQAGSQVALFEKRSTLFDRTQVVRLDPKWVSILQLYLGEKFNQLFLDEGHPGILRKDGFVEIVTRDLEEKLNERLTELKSIAQEDSLATFAAHELSAMITPSSSESKFKVIARYIQNQDKMGETPKPSLEECYEVDFLFCAGGKSSALTKKFLPSSHPVTESSYYGVCSWTTLDSKKFKGQSNSMTHFQDFRGMIKIDQSFINDFKKAVVHRMSGALTEKQKYEGFLDNLDAQDWMDRPYLQTRTFENKGLIYIGMELPSKLEEIMVKIDENPDLDSEEKKQIQASIKFSWYDQIGKKYKITDDLIMDEKFTAFFSVEQNRLSEEHLYSKITTETSQAFIMPVGDAFASPHFMRYSGLTGARENVIHLQEYMKAHIQDPTQEDILLDQLHDRANRTAAFVIHRGTAFLPLKSLELVTEERIQHMKHTLDEAMDNWSSKDSFMTTYPNTGLEDEFPSVQNYRLCHKGSEYEIKPKDGYLEVIGLSTSYYKKFESIEQLKILFEIYG